VPPDGAQRFAQALQTTYGANPDKLDVTLHSDVAHAFTPAMWQNALNWFQKFL
jgi:hypothetical protein